MATKWDPKDPADRLDYTRSWEKELGKLNDPIFESNWRIEHDTEDPVQLTTDGNGVNGLLTWLWLSGGTPGETYRVVNTIETDQGRRYERTVFLQVREL